MSGGHWQYSNYEMREAIESVGNDGIVIRKAPKLAEAMIKLAELLDKTIHDLDWDLSGDHSIEDWDKFEKDFIKNLGKIAKMKLVVKTYQIDEKGE